MAGRADSQKKPKDVEKKSINTNPVRWRAQHSQRESRVQRWLLHLLPVPYLFTLTPQLAPSLCYADTDLNAWQNSSAKYWCPLGGKPSSISLRDTGVSSPLHPPCWLCPTGLNGRWWSSNSKCIQENSIAKLPSEWLIARNTTQAISGVSSPPADIKDCVDVAEQHCRSNGSIFLSYSGCMRTALGWSTGQTLLFQWDWNI